MQRTLFALLALALLTSASFVSAQPAPRRQERAPAEATIIPLSENWRMDGDIPVNVLLISLQGLANRDYPRVYLEYPTHWQWETVRPLIGFMERRHGTKFTRLGLNDADAALARFARHAKGYVVWDREVRTSVNVAFTAAGVLDAVVVSEELIPLAEKHGLKQLEDLRGIFRGKSDFEIYSWAVDKYWDRCSRDYYAVLGGHAGMEMQPGVADFAIMQRAFCADLSANPKHPDELGLLRTLLGRQNPTSTVIGWHSYAKDTEGQHTTLTGNFGLKMEGLHNLPNVSYTCQIPLTPDFRFTNNHSVAPDAKLQAEKKVYIAALATDSMGIGTWTKPGRGDIPYAWQVLVNWSWMNPPAFQYFYESKTPNDYFIGGLSGPGYMYPQSVPADKFPALMRDMRALMATLDLNVLEIMEHTEGHRRNGIANLSREVGDRYYREFPDVHGFINGYSAAQSFDLRDRRPLISYDYYLAVDCTVANAAADLDELMRLNDQRPYFLLVHVRESNTVEKVRQIIERLSEKVEVVPLDVFLKLAADRQTYQTRYQEPAKPEAKPATKNPGDV